jgi:hypothetical protein
MSGHSSGEEPSATSDIFQPTPMQLAKWHFKNYFGAAALLGIAVLAAILYLAFMVIISHHLPRWMP